MANLMIDEDRAARTVLALRALGAEALTARPADAAEMAGHASLLAAVACMDAEHRRAAAAICAEAMSLARVAQDCVAEILAVDQELGGSPAHGAAVDARDARDE
ncbi:hypothetical protein [Demequina sp. NBRC 110054]|uniref:hypothetical protein n=1 Tax=Demequina sp. NBRC 110054 TaxID=1570343 RepID=UPI0009FF0D23|nr:hypothetical protein [Demequina sp. NBRC 110054]